MKNGGETDVDCGGPCVPCLPSCSGGLDCGGVSCCLSIVVPGGTFPMGIPYDPGQSMDQQPEHPALVDTFSLDAFEVTVGRFRKFVNAFNGDPPSLDAGAHPLIAGSGWQTSWNSSLPSSQGALTSGLKSCQPANTWTDNPGMLENAPINCVSWFEAFAFCVWDGGRLPTEAEWEYAAAGGSDDRIYPWGSADPFVNPALANSAHSDNSPFVAVGSHPQGNGKWGHRDMAGSVGEWTLDLYDDLWYGNGPCNNCANVNQGSVRVWRGGAFSQIATFLTVARRSADAGFLWWGHGFRCARAP